MLPLFFSFMHLAICFPPIFKHDFFSLLMAVLSSLTLLLSYSFLNLSYFCCMFLLSTSESSFGLTSTIPCKYASHVLSFIICCSYCSSMAIINIITSLTCNFSSIYYDKLVEPSNTCTFLSFSMTLLFHTPIYFDVMEVCLVSKI